jgi:hypothetical protein
MALPRLPNSPLFILAAILAFVMPAGIGLTAPMWLFAMGMKLDVANTVGLRIIGVTTLMLTLAGGGWMVVVKPWNRPHHPPKPEHDEDDEDEAAEEEQELSFQDRMIHMIILLLFVVPFALIIIGFIKGQLEALAVAD